MDTLLIIGFISALLIGAIIGSILLFRNPGNWVGFVGYAVKKLRPIILAYMFKRMSPDKEKELHDCIRRGGEWDHIRKRCKR